MRRKNLSITDGTIRRYLESTISNLIRVSNSGDNARKMDDELLELQRQFEFAQQVKSSVRLSDRNVVELVQKLQELGVIDFDLLHTVTGKEYITQV